MGTHALTVLYDNPWGEDDPEEIAVLYSQFDGYPDGHGKELAEFLQDFEITNGLAPGKTANGGSCLAAQVIAHFKEAAGGFYLYPAGSRGEHFVYHVLPAVGEGITLKVEAGDTVIFDGPVEDWDTAAVAKANEASW